MPYGDLAILVAALLLIRNLIFDLQRTGTGVDHFLRQQISRFSVAEARIDVRNDGDVRGERPAAMAA